MRLTTYLLSSKLLSISGLSIFLFLSVSSVALAQSQTWNQYECALPKNPVLYQHLNNTTAHPARREEISKISLQQESGMTATLLILRDHRRTWDSPILAEGRLGRLQKKIKIDAVNAISSIENAELRNNVCLSYDIFTTRDQLIPHSYAPTVHRVCNQYASFNPLFVPIMKEGYIDLEFKGEIQPIKFETGFWSGRKSTVFTGQPIPVTETISCYPKDIKKISESPGTSFLLQQDSEFSFVISPPIELNQMASSELELFNLATEKKEGMKFSDLVRKLARKEINGIEISSIQKGYNVDLMRQASCFSYKSYNERTFQKDEYSIIKNKGRLYATSNTQANVDIGAVVKEEITGNFLLVSPWGAISKILYLSEKVFALEQSTFTSATVPTVCVVK